MASDDYKRKVEIRLLWITLLQSAAAELETVAVPLFAPLRLEPGQPLGWFLTLFAIFIAEHLSFMTVFAWFIFLRAHYLRQQLKAMEPEIPQSAYEFYESGAFD